jgi:hypothetical protein
MPLVKRNMIEVELVVLLMALALQHLPHDAGQE